MGSEPRCKDCRVINCTENRPHDENGTTHGLDGNGTTHGLDENGTTHGLDENGTTHGLDENGTTHGLDENGTTHGPNENGTTHGPNENGTTHGPHEKIKATNELLQDKCSVSNDVGYIDLSNIEAEDLWDGIHVNTLGGSKLAKNIARTVDGKRTNTVATTTKANTFAFATRKPHTFGELAGVRRRRRAAKELSRNQNTPTEQSRGRRQPTRGDQGRDLYRPAGDRRHYEDNAWANSDWQTLPQPGERGT